MAVASGSVMTDNVLMRTTCAMNIEIVGMRVMSLTLGVAEVIY